MEEADHPAPKIQGVVIISLPPKDNPSLGKTITAFTISDSDSDSVIPHHEQNHPNDPETNNDLAFQSYPPSPQHRFSFTKIFSLFGVILFALFLYGSVSNSETLLRELRRNSERDEGSDSFVFPLFPKFGIHGQQDVKLKLGKLVVDSQQKEGLVASSKVAAVDSSSSSVFPVRGNVYPDGYVC